MASASAAYYVSQAPSYPQSVATHKMTSRKQIRHEMQREKLELQDLCSEYYGLLLDTYERTIISDAKPAQALNQLLDTCQQMLNTNQPLLPETVGPAELRFWYQFSTTIEQYCRLQQRLMNYPVSVSKWQLEHALCRAC